MLYLKYFNYYNCFSIVIVLITIFTACKKQEEKLEYGIAKFRGSITGNIPKEAQMVSFTLAYSNPFIGTISNYNVELDDKGNFYVEVPMAAITMAGMESPAYSGVICLGPNKETKLTIYFDDLGKKHINLENELGYTSNEIIESRQNLLKYLLSYSIVGNNYTLPPNEYSKVVVNRIDSLENIIKQDSTISETMRNIIFNELKMFYLDAVLLDYQESVKLGYLGDKKNAPEIKDPEKSYYIFLKDFDLNNKENLYNGSYPAVIQKLLKNKVLHIPPLKDQPIEDWIKSVKNELGYLIDSKDKLFYDILTSISYGNQLNNMQPLSDTQIKNIKYYYANTVFKDVLINENQKVHTKIQANIDNRVKTIPKVDKEKLMNTIISDYKGKVVFVDFWATWCGPCIVAMDKANIVKRNLKGRNIIFVYFTTTSSPKKLWLEYITNIEGEHYYLEEKEWNYILGNFQLDGIPAYLIYDKTGNLKHKQTSFMGEEKMQQWIEELL